MKILKRNTNIYNVILFQLFTLVFLHVNFSLVDGYSSLDLNTLNLVLEHNLGLVVISLVNIFFIFFVKKISKYLLILTTTATSIICFLLFLESFNKSILLYNILYTVISYFFCMIWKLELDEASYNSFFDSRILRPLGLDGVKVFVNTGATKFSGVITNWSRETFFLVVDDSVRSIGDCEIDLSYMGVDFSFRAEIVTRTSEGLGLKVIDEQKLVSLNWFDFYDIISDRGITPLKI